MSGTAGAVQRLDRMKAFLLHARGDDAIVCPLRSVARGLDPSPMEVSSETPTLKCGTHTVALIVWTARAREQGLEAVMAHALKSGCAAVLWRPDDEPAPSFWRGSSYGADASSAAIGEALRLAALRAHLSETPRRKAPVLASIAVGLLIGHAVGFGAVAASSGDQVRALEEARREVRLAAIGPAPSKRTEYTLFKPAVAAAASPAKIAPTRAASLTATYCSAEVLRPAMAFNRERPVFAVAHRLEPACAQAGDPFASPIVSP